MLGRQESRLLPRRLRHLPRLRWLVLFQNDDVVLESCADGRRIFLLELGSPYRRIATVKIIEGHDHRPVFVFEDFDISFTQVGFEEIFDVFDCRFTILDRQVEG